MRNPTIPAGVFTEVEEEFFRAGAALEQDSLETWDDLDEPRTPSLWRRWFSKRPATEPALPIDNDNDNDDDWEWAIAIARARASTAV